MTDPAALWFPVFAGMTVRDVGRDGSVWAGCVGFNGEVDDVDVDVW